jgi:outer membrane protein
MLHVKKWARVLVVVVPALLVAPGVVTAQVAKPLKVGFVNVQRLLIESPQANAANRALENEFAPRQRDLVAKQKAFKDRADKFQKDGAVMGADERRNTENDLRRDERDLGRQVDELREDLNNRKNEELGKLRVNVLREIEGFAKQGAYDLIVSDALYVNPALDVTAQVLQGLQSRGGAASGPTKAPAKP